MFFGLTEEDGWEDEGSSSNSDEEEEKKTSISADQYAD